MAFAGDAGAAGGMIAVGTLHHPRGDVVYDSDGHTARVEAASGRLLLGGQDQTPDMHLRTLMIHITGEGLLAGHQDDTEDGSAADTGILDTDAPGANIHGIPSNFGPGRGNWTDEDVARTRVSFLPTDTIAATGAGTKGVLQLTQLSTAGRLQLIFKNLGRAITELMVHIHYDHSQEI